MLLVFSDDLSCETFDFTKSTTLRAWDTGILNSPEFAEMSDLPPNSLADWVIVLNPSVLCPGTWDIEILITSDPFWYDMDSPVE